ncbi:hypothetical protein GA0116948_101592 [Chitinophaga costaii]|uniref:Uncharacterized protein n=1 Tax=Chitinophaga costaii TaxID=1335309 RepID=A0A1C3ZXF6_9BACT|nr:hypothetical protein GA0116948_101592 [Chitinophaga costaii]
MIYIIIQLIKHVNKNLNNRYMENPQSNAYLA